MKYKVIHAFADLSDNKYKYEAGDRFPRHGLDVSEERLQELESNKNKAGIPLIVKVNEPKKPTKKKQGKKKDAD